ncbi:MAG: TonB-dependent receptor [Bacteroidales bacterium]|nr:TonB-dependent receptor [Bacteroidales bacterium]
MKRFTKMILLTVAILAGSISAMAQQITATGVVKDSQGVAVIGASVIQTGTNNGVITDLDGAFSLSVPSGATIEISSIGYKTVSVTAGRDLSITLQDDNELLDEVVVVGYGVQKKSDLTGAISSVNAKDIENRTLTSAGQALLGKTAGVNIITASAQPGANQTVRVRGFSSNGTSDPLYVVDGLIVSSIADLDPNFIESMEVLKDAASAAIYGAQAGNGVVLITTKQASKGRSSINYDFQYSISNLARRPVRLTAEEALQQQKELDATFNDAQIQQLIDDHVWDGKTSTDWYDVAFTPSAMQHHTVTLQGANDKASVLTSLSYLDDNGIVIGDKDRYKRITALVNADYQVKPWMKVGVNATYSKTSSTGISDGNSNSSYGSMIAPVMTMPAYYAPTYSPDALPTTMQGQLAAGYFLFKDENGNYYNTLGGGEMVHPAVNVKRSETSNVGHNLNSTLYANFTPIKGLVLTSRLGYNLSVRNYYNYNHFFYGSTSVKNLEQNAATRRINLNQYYQWENFANYTKTISKHTFGAMVGMSYSESISTLVEGSVNKVEKDDPAYWDVRYPAGDATISANGYQTPFRKLSYFGRLNYSYADKYILEAVMRADAADSSVLPFDNKWGYFPSFSAGWVLSKENFMSFLKSANVSFLKLRASWGLNGSTSNLGGYQYSNSLATSATGYSFTNGAFSYITSAQPAQLSNPNLKWETSEQLDFGIDFRMFKERLSITADWYKKETKDLIVSGIILPYEAGNSAAPMNAGNVRNTGFEIDFGWKDQIGDFGYSINANIATLKNKVTYLDPNVSGGRIEGSSRLHSNGSFSAFEVGYPVWYFRGWNVEKIDENGVPVFTDKDHNDVINADDKDMIGKAFPDFTYGLTLSMNYKGFDALIFGNGSQGNDLFMAYQYFNISYSLKELFDQRWTPQNPNGKYAKPAVTNAEKYNLSNHLVFDGSYFRIKQIQLGYTLPNAITKKAAIEKLRVYASLDNWFLFTKYPGMDPEASASSTSGMGVDYGNYSTTRKVVFGLSLTF